ncbi:hypothetical protein [Saccharopolyspora hattusasensis]|uniref:hypothetical protein n=1 Tax=Saccharopolyspora hattusasensis TaxID=1128679 RepID=UPI003D96B957
MEMEGLAAGASALAGRAEGLRAAVDNGQLVMDPEAAERVARVYAEKADDILFEIQDVERLIARDAYGNCFIGRQMDKKMADKIEHPEFGAVPILQKMEQILRNIAQAYRDSARDMQNTDDDRAHDLRKNV